MCVCIGLNRRSRPYQLTVLLTPSRGHAGKQLDRSVCIATACAHGQSFQTD